MADKYGRSELWYAPKREYPHLHGSPELWYKPTKPEREYPLPPAYRAGSLQEFAYRQSLIPEDIQELLESEKITASNIRRLLGEISDWNTLSDSLTRPVDKIAKWLIDYVELPKLREKFNRESEEGMETDLKRRILEGQYKYGEWGAPTGERTVGGPGVRLEEMRAEARKRAEGPAEEIGEREYPVADWMKTYLESSRQLGKEREGGIRPGIAYQLRPLGAQAKTSLEELGEMKGYHTWGKAGAPLSYEKYAKARESEESWWEEYRRLSESLFPTRVGVKQASWYPRTQ